MGWRRATRIEPLRFEDAIICEEGVGRQPPTATAPISIAVRLRAPRAVAVACEAAPGIRVTLKSE
jgi:hypothetical protein